MNINKIQKYLIAFFVLCMSIIPCFVLFTNPCFIETGHDNIYHFSQIQDLYIALKNGTLNSLISPTLNHQVGIGTRLMYGSLSHYLVAILGFIIIPLGGNLMLSYKLVILLSYLLSNIVMYKLGLYIFKDKSKALLCVTIFALFPYRFTDIYVRNAFAETIFISLLPVVVFGLVKWLKESYSLSSYLMVFMGMTAIIHTHNSSAVFTFIFILIFLGINYKHLIYCFSNDKRHTYTLTSCLVVSLFICLPFFVTLIESYTSNLYQIFNKQVMGTDFNGILGSYKSVLSYFIYSFSNKWRSYLLVCVPGLLLPMIIYYFFDKYKYKNYLFTISFAFFALLCSMTLNSLYVLIGFGLTFIILVLLINEQNKETYKIINKSIIILTIVSLVLLFFVPIWYIFPSILYNIQFVWRMWGFICVFASLAIPILLNKLLKIRKRYLTYSIAMCVGLLTICSYPVGIDSSFFSNEATISEQITTSPNASGWQLEYFPSLFFDDNYQTSSKLYQEIKKNIFNSNDVSYSPYVYEGDAQISNYQNETIPNLSFYIDVNEESIIQLPLLYYKGYTISFTTNDKTVVLDNYELDGLVAFSITQSGTINVSYSGTMMYKIASVFKILGIVIATISVSYIIYNSKICKNKKKIVK